MKTPIKLTVADTAWGGRAMEILPAMSEIPEEFFSSSNKWAKLAGNWFFHGLKGVPECKAELDRRDVITNLQTALRSFEPKHEHKQAGVAYLMSQWLLDQDEATFEAFSQSFTK